MHHDVPADRRRGLLGGFLKAATPRFPLRQFCQETAVLLDSGIALHEALTALQERERKSYASSVLAVVLDHLRQGRGLGASLRACADAFDPLFVATVEAGQRTGQTASILRRHADYLEWLSRSRARLISAAIYPTMLLVVGSAVMLFLVAFVIPRFADIYQDLGAELPWMTRMLMRGGSAVSEYWPFLLCAVVLASIGAAMLWRSMAVRIWISGLVWRLPRIGDALRLVQLARFYRTMGLLVQSGVTVPAALSLVRESVAAPMRAAASAVEVAVVEGRKLSDGLEGAALCDAVSLRMVRVGERSGALGTMMEKVADFHDEDLGRLAEWFGRVVGPLLMLLMGAAIGVVVVLMYMPIFDVAERIQ